MTKPPRESSESPASGRGTAARRTAIASPGAGRLASGPDIDSTTSPQPGRPRTEGHPQPRQTRRPAHRTPSGGRPTSLNAGMLNAAALRGPVTTTMPLTTTATATATPLAYVPPEPPRPPVAPTRPHPPLLDPGNIGSAHQPRPTAPITAPPPTQQLSTPLEPANPSAPPPHGPPAAAAASARPRTTSDRVPTFARL